MLKEQIESGEYRVNPTAVADAMLRRLQNECWYPASGPSASRNVTPGGPSQTEPIQVTLLRLFGLRSGIHAVLTALDLLSQHCRVHGVTVLEASAPSADCSMGS